MNVQLQCGGHGHLSFALCVRDPPFIIGYWFRLHSLKMIKPIPIYVCPNKSIHHFFQVPLKRVGKRRMNQNCAFVTGVSEAIMQIKGTPFVCRAIPS